MAKMPEQCPSCQAQLVITQLSCPVCDTTVSGRFESNPLSRLAADDLSFVRRFVLTKGNLKEMERDLGISYWTIRRKLDEVVESLEEVGAAAEAGPDDAAVSQARLAVLGRLRRGEVGAEEAEALLKAIRRGPSAKSDSEAE